MRKIGIIVEAHHHEVATAGQSEIDMQFQPLVKMADQFMWYKYICKNVAKRRGKTVTFMPKPIFEDNGSGMHTHTSLWKGGKPLFAGDGYAGLSEMGLHAAGGSSGMRRRSSPSRRRRQTRIAVWCPDSKRRSTSRCRRATGRPPFGSRCTRRVPKAKRLEFRCPDPSCNGYLAWSAMLMAMLDGIQNKIDPGKPLDRDIYEMTRKEMAEMGIRTTPGSLVGGHRRARAGPRVSHPGRRLHRGSRSGRGSSTSGSSEIDPLRLRPHPHEFYLYYDN